MREFIKCPQCGLISSKEIMLTVPAMAGMIKREWVCKCDGQAIKELGDSKKDLCTLHAKLS